MTTKEATEAVRAAIELEFRHSREKSLALTKLDEMEMWCSRCERMRAVQDQIAHEMSFFESNSVKP